MYEKAIPIYERLLDGNYKVFIKNSE